MTGKTAQAQSRGLSPRVWARLLPYVRRHRVRFTAVIVLMLISAGIEGAFPLFTKYAVNNYVVRETTAGIGGFVLLYLAVILLGGVTMVLYSKQSFNVEMGIGKSIREDCFVHLQKLPISYYSVNSVGYVVARVMSDTDRISGMVSWGLSNMVWGLFYILFCIVYMFFLSARLALIVVAVIPAAGLITWLFQRRIIVVNRRVREINSQITGAYNEGVTGSKTSKTLVIEDENSKEFSVLTRRISRELLRLSRLNGLMLPLVTSLGAIAVGAVLYRGGVLTGSEMLDYGTLSAFITYAAAVIEPIVQTAMILSEMVSAQVNIERVTALLGEPLTVTDTPEAVERYGGIFNPKRENWEPLRGDIEFEDVWFKYPDGGEYVLEGFSLKIPAGTTVAIVGETGAGKSTIVNLACRFYEPTRGRILIDGRDYRERSQLWLHSSLGYVLQDPHLFSGTIKENIRYGRLEASDEEVIRAARLVSADIAAERMPSGYDTEVGEGGDRLSTGEKQLISFARAVLADPPIFVLDEATSSIDSETELLIQDAIAHILKGRTSFIIAHRLSTIVRSDLILVVDGGKVVESGTHGELLAAGGRYSTLYEAMRLNERAI